MVASMQTDNFAAAQPLAELLVASLAGSRTKVSQAISSICHSHDEARQQVVELGGLVLLTDLLTSPDLEPPYRQAIAEAIAHGISGKASIVQMRRLDGMKPLIQLLRSSALTSQAMGAFAVQAICHCSTDLASLFSQQGGLQPLSAMLHSSSSTCQQQAALAISSFCCSNCCSKGTWTFPCNFNPICVSTPSGSQQESLCICRS